ncbi:MAG: DUF2974 domain-containing protein [Lachnospiraceae bacterium]|nr:DUF2974 domain-containing protein [Lachnospiraceae bacterium]MDD3617236.1 DUF2974 domain-containing protein [Lachnospiraceae bacterium]
MGNVISYLKWRGDLNFKERSFCEVDNLALAMLSYENLNGIVAGPESKESISVREAFDKCSEKSRESVLKYMAQSKRYEDARLSDYSEIFDEETQTQFGALCITLDSGEKYISFRGTDDSIIGWREDFSISYQVVQAQKEAVNYLEKVINLEDNYYIGGHSKGGNLAIFASMCCTEEKQNRIRKIFCNDGPGICEEMMNRKKFKQIQSKIIKYVPEFCIIGRLFELTVREVMVGSSATGILQHDGMTWQVEGDHFRYVKESPDNCKTYNKIFDEWIESADMEQRKTFTKDFFDALAENGRKTFEEVAESGVDGYGTILLSIVESESRTKVVIGKFLKSCISQMKTFDSRDYIRTQAGVRAVICILLGMIFIFFREHAIQGVGIFLLLATWGWSGKRLLDVALREEKKIEQKRRRILLYMFLMCLSVLAVSHYRLILVYGNIVIGCLLCYFSIKKVREAADRNKKMAIRVGKLIISGLSFMIGISALATPSSSFWGKMITMGSLLVLYGIGEMLKAVFIDKG